MKTLLSGLGIIFILAGLVNSGWAIILNPIESQNYTIMSQSPVEPPDWTKNILGIEEYELKILDFDELKEIQKPVIIPLNKEDGMSFIIVDDIRIAPYIKEIETETEEGTFHKYELAYKELIYYRDNNSWIATMDTDRFQEEWDGTVFIPTGERKLTPWLDVSNSLSYDEIKTILNENLGAIYVYLPKEDNERELVKVVRISAGLGGEVVNCKDEASKMYTFSPSEFDELRDGLIYIFAENLNIYKIAYHNAKIRDVFYHLVRETGINYIFMEDYFYEIGKGEGNLTGVSLDKALRYLLKDTGLIHYMEGSILSLAKEEEKN